MTRPAVPRELGVRSNALKKSNFGEVQPLPRMNRSTAPQSALAGEPQPRMPFKFIKLIIPGASVPAPCVVTQKKPITLHYLHLGTGCHGLKNISPGFPVHQPQPWLGEKTLFRLALLALPSCNLSPVPPQVTTPELPILRPSPPAARSRRRHSPTPCGKPLQGLTLPQKFNQTNQYKRGKKNK